VELLVTLAMMGVILGVSTLAFRRIEKPAPGDPYSILADSQRVAVANGRSVTLRLMVHGIPAEVTVYSDGSILGDSVLGIDRLAGRMPNAR